MLTKNYRTRTAFRDMDNKLRSETCWPIGLDIGYSGVKTCSGNMISCFPSYAAQNKYETRLLLGGEEDERRILYRDDETGEWEVGALAQNSISASDSTAGSMAIYGRSRYYSPMFKVIARVGLAAGLLSNRYGTPSGKKIQVITGLPPKYLKSASADLKTVLSGHHVFSVKFGNGAWIDFDFTLDYNDIGIIDQPQGTLFSIATNPEMRLLPDAKKYFTSRVLVVDPGFGTVDIFPMNKKNTKRDDCQTFAELGMKQVLKLTSDDIFKQFNFEVSVPAMQSYLESGQVIKREGRKTSKVGFDDILEKNSKLVCNEVIEEIVNIYDPAMSFDYMVLTGGTGAAWSSYFRNSEYFKECETMQIISGNQGDPSLPYLYSNVRGYYIFALSRVR